MPKYRSFEISTRMVSGDEDSLKAAINRAVIGVTVLKHKRRPYPPESHSYNQALVQDLSSCIHDELFEQFRRALPYLKIRTSLTVIWDDYGKINEINDIKIPVYLQIGELRIEKVKIKERVGPVKVDFFSSKFDTASAEIRTYLEELMRKLGQSNLKVKEYDFLSDGKQLAKQYGISMVPSIVINEELPALQNPDKKSLWNRISSGITPEVEAIGKSFAMDPALMAVFKETPMLSKILSIR